MLYIIIRLEVLVEIIITSWNYYFFLAHNIDSKFSQLWFNIMLNQGIISQVLVLKQTHRYIQNYTVDTNYYKQN